MIIENPDAFKSWLTSILEPLCDADPAALAKYVYALVKKDKPLEELREGMLDQLDVFLQQETKPFVDMLFKSLETFDYLKDVPEKQPSPPHSAMENDKPLDVDEQPACATSASAPGAKSPTGASAVAAAPALAAEAPRHRLVLPRTRGPHQEQTLVKVLPLTELLEEPLDQPPRRRDRRSDSLRDKEERRRRRSRSWERRARPRRHAREPEHAALHPAHAPHANDARRYDKRRPLSRSPSPRGRYRNRSPPPAVIERQPSRSRSRSPVPLRDRDYDRERERLRIPREMERDRMSRDREHRDRVSRSRDRERSRDRSRDRSRGSASPRLEVPDAYKRRCRDYDEKGYCMRGDFCEWDHGTDPLVLEDATLSRVLPIPPPVPEYNPLAPDIWCGAGFPPFGAHPHAHALPHHALPPHAPHAQHPPRELVPIPRVRHESRAEGRPEPRSEARPEPPPAPRHERPPPKKNFDYHRLGARAPPLPANAGNCSLEVKKVPRGLNDITHLNNHFSKFGKIVNIQVSFEGEPEAALITFSTPAEANVAYKSTEAVLNNRFIKVFWHNPENKQENTAPGGQQAGKQERQTHAMSHNKVLINRDNIKATADNKLSVQAEKAKDIVNGQEAKKEVIKPLEKNKQLVDVQKRCQALLQTQLQQQRLLIQRLETGNVSAAQKPVLLEAINSAQEAIEKLRNELNFTMKQLQEESVARSMSRLQLAQVKKPKTREEAQKEILDAELDMFTKQQEGQDVTELLKKIAELRRQMSLQFPTHPVIRRGHSRGGRFSSSRFVRGGLGAAGAGKAFSVNQSIDHRPRALLVSGFEPDELDALLAHFAQFGEVTGKEVNLTVPELVLQYRARAMAELAMQRARHYNDRTLSITWVTNNKPIGASQPAPQVQNGDAVVDEPKENEKHQSEETLLRFDEEEEEEAEEDRSWRR